MSYFFLILALVIAVIDWYVVARGWKRAEYVAKPAVMIALLLWFWQIGGFQFPMLWFALGVLFSMGGDIFLMLPEEQFIAGLVSFLIAHIFYLIGLNPTLPPINLASLLVAVFIAVAAVQIYRAIAAGLRASGRPQLQMPVLAYTTVISLMLFSALVTLIRPEWEILPAMTISAGALLFFISDAVLAWNKFVSPLRYGRLVNLSTYHLGQILIALGAALHFL